MDTIAGIPTQDIVHALRTAVTEARVTIRELEQRRTELEMDWRREDLDLREQIREIESQNKTAKDALKALMPPRNKSEMAREILTNVYQVFLEHPTEEFSHANMLDELKDLAWEYEGRGFENRIRAALNSLTEQGYLSKREKETTSRRMVHLFKIRNKRKKLELRELVDGS